MTEKEFVPGEARLDALLSDIGDAVAALEGEAAELDCVHATSLAMLREAGERARSELVRELRISREPRRRWSDVRRCFYRRSRPS
ncbi:hypothetical protein ACNUCX_11220 [Curtobacterium flaccumfaciens pv. flaccumfaciens]|uniref:hypothetical protein n=1 Tax=Curtobacterium flaccumfaciens TaxID=2035 RepID=UPI003AB3ABEB